MIIINFGRCHGGCGRINSNSTKFVLFLPLGTDALNIDWVDFCWVGWHKIRVIYQKWWGRLTVVAKKYVLVELRFFHSKHLL